MDKTNRQLSWIDFEKRPAPASRAIMTRMSVPVDQRPKYGGSWFLPQITLRTESDDWYITKNGGHYWNYVFGPDFHKRNRFQWRDIPGTSLRQAIQMAKLAQES